MQHHPEIEVSPDEEPDWDFARNRQVLLKSRIGEWSSSVFSVEVFLRGERFVGPNRDYPYQGLLVSVGGRTYKVLDGIMFSMKGGAKSVSVGAHRARYKYAGLELDLSFAEGSFRAAFSEDGVRVLSFFDFRRVDCWGVSESIQIVPQGRWLRLFSGALEVALGPFKEIQSVDYVTDWVYKLGSGFRHVDQNGYVRFVRETRKISAPAVCTLDGKEMKVIVNFGASVGRNEGTRGSGGLNSDDSLNDLSWMGRVYFEPNLRDLMILRLSTLRGFGLYINGTWFPEAGCWWFRSPWVRDALEGIINNFQTYTRVFRWEDKIMSLAGMLMKILEEKRTLPNFIGGKEHSADGLPLLLYLGYLLGGDLKDKAVSLAAELLSEMEARDIAEEGPPVLRGGLVACTPYQSWTDSRINGRACRLPSGWDEKDQSLPKYYLPEVNGLWIRALRGLCRYTAVGELAERLSELERAFRGRMWNGRFLSDIVDSESGRRYGELTSMGMVGMVTALHLFGSDEVSSGYQQVKRLIVNRTLRVLGDATLPFGVAISRRVESYLGDGEYHRSTIWPRDTPYLIELLEHVGLEMEIRGILLNNLDHMISEGVLLYSNELFGHPVGRNPCPSEGSGNPVPLKNPAQYWSHWCDPYLNRFFRLA